MSEPIKPTPRVDILEKLLGVFDEEQARIVCDLLVRARDRAIERRCDIDFRLTFNRRGYPRHWHVDDNGTMPKPKMYQAE